MIKEITIQNTQEEQTSEEKLEIFRLKINELVKAYNLANAEIASKVNKANKGVKNE